MGASSKRRASTITPALLQVQYTAPISGPCDLTQFNSGDFTHFLPLNCQLIDPIKLAHPIATKVTWLMNLDLAKVDHVFSVIVPGTGFALSALAVLAALLQFVQVRMTSPKPNRDDPTSSTTNTMTYLFPLLTIWWGGLFPSGLILYWVVYTAYLIAQQFRIMGWGNLFPLFGWQPRFAPAPDAASGAVGRRGDAGVASSPAAKKSGQPSTPPPAGSPGAARQGRRPENKKRRGRKR